MAVRALLLAAVVTHIASAGRADADRLALLDPYGPAPTGVDDRPPGDAPPRASLGSARTLRGTICLRQVFVEDDEGRWTAGQRADSEAALDAALTFLAEQAAARGVGLDWRLAPSSIATCPGVVTDGEDHGWTDFAVTASPRRVRPRLSMRRSVPAPRCDGTLTVLHVPRPGRSFALPATGDGDERVAMFRRARWWSDASDPERHAAFVHEILHLFGAEDLYRPDERRRAAGRHYPHDVMLRADRPLDDRSIGAYTAYLIGWTEAPPGRLD